ncbi:MAG TPA: DASS family sodium-coupled anion symporter [Pirellulales bacterium]|nr:DASS family sodium-coupled anion symporter [Pirellulales bacterium]
MDQPAAPLSRIEQQFERWRALAGWVLAPLAFIAVWQAEFPSLKPEAHRLAAVLAAVVTLWITEAVAMPVTALLGASLCVVLRVAPAKEVFAPFADPIMFLFIGSFILARAIFLHGLDRRLAFGALSLGWVGGSPSRILFAFGAVTAVMSAWISNTATTAMMFAIGLSILRFLMGNGETPAVVDRRYATGLMLMTSFAASIGGLATPVGTPPNLIGLGTIRDALGVEIPFLKWSFVGVPIVVCLFLYLFIYLNWLCTGGSKPFGVSGSPLADERRRLGPWTSGQRSTVVAFAITVLLWIAPGVVAVTAGEQSEVYKTLSKCLPESVAALLGAALLFVLPGDRQGRAITWREAVEIDWGVVLLYGGGFALGVLSERLGLAASLGKSLVGLLPSTSGLTLVIASAAVATLVSELTSNTASAIIVVPVAINIAQAAGADPLEPALAATFAASLGFMLPVSTPCNAIVYGSGYVPLTRMVRYGLLLDVAGVAVIVVMVRLLSRWVL